MKERVNISVWLRNRSNGNLSALVEMKSRRKVFTSPKTASDAAPVRRPARREQSTKEPRFRSGRRIACTAGGAMSSVRYRRFRNHASPGGISKVHLNVDNHGARKYIGGIKFAVQNKERLMLIVDWKPITETEEIPPFGEELAVHIRSYKGAVRQASCSAWNLLYRMLISMDIPPGSVSFTKTGKPYFTDIDICFSISHSKDICAAAVSDHQVGVDVERVRDDYKDHLIRRTLSEEEMKTYDGDFTRMWCRKEALVKMSGEGIKSYPFNINTTEHSFWEKQIEYSGSKYWIVSTQPGHS